MKLTTTTFVEANLTLVLPDSFAGASPEKLRQAILDDEAQLLSLELPSGNEALSTACYDLRADDIGIDDTPLTPEEANALELNHYFTHQYS